MEVKMKKPDDWPTLKGRAIPAPLSKAIKDLNYKQRQAVISMGFGHILYLKVLKLPQKLTYWVLDNFNPRRCQIQLPENGGSVPITEDDVALVFGFPQCRTLMERKKMNHPCKLIDSWRQRVQK
ncbi:hypothetical protein C2S51_008718 [Perilla frutescens var. frutescens]|nr:hypothetical protein C2S51_008718 [Perilla frutescens var. frutescens]